MMKRKLVALADARWPIAKRAWALTGGPEANTISVQLVQISGP